MTSEVDIANLALDSIGARATIASFSEGSAEARAIARQYAPSRDAVLSAAHWNFARKQAALTLIKDATEGDTVPAPWLYEYAYPADCVHARFIMPVVQVDSSVAVGTPAAPYNIGPPIRFLIATDGDTQGQPIKVILTNQPQAVLVYTWRVTNPALYDPPFIIGFSNYLGSRICMALNGDRARARDAFQIADLTTKEARATNGNEGGPTVLDQVPDWIRVRGYEADLGQPYSPFILSPNNLVFIGG